MLNSIPSVLIDVGDAWAFLLMLLVLTLILYSIQSVINRKKERQILQQLEEPQKYNTVIRCLSNDFTMEREFSEGDFVGKVVGTCPRCNNSLVIDSIYAVYPLPKKGVTAHPHHSQR